MKVLLWLVGSALLGILSAFGSQVAVVRTHGGSLDPVSLLGAGQLMPGAVTSLMATQLKLIWPTTSREPGWTVVAVVCLIFVGAGAFWWGVIAGSSQLDAAFIALASMIFYACTLAVVGSGVVVSES